MSLEDVSITLVDTIDDASEMQRWLGERRPILAVDTETEDIHWWRDRVRLIQLGDAQRAFVVPWELWGGAALSALAQYGRPMAMHNAGFDVKMVEHWTPHRFERHLLHDTRVLAHILDPHKPTGLKPLSARTIDSRAAYAQRELDEGMKAGKWTWATVPLTFEPYWVYAGLDTVLTARIWEELYPKVMASAPEAYELEMATTWAIVGMERTGVAVDLDHTRKMQDAFRGYVDDVAAWCVAEYGVKPGSNQAVIKRIADDTGYTFTKLTKDGKLSLDKEVLAEVIYWTKHPLAVAVGDRRKFENLVKYTNGFLTFEHDGRIHPSFNILKSEGAGYGARTGRMSISDPPLQQLPRKSNSSPAAIQVRNCITASEGRKLIMCDFDQIEARMFAHFSGDPGLLGAFGAGDFFTNMARMIYRDPTIERSDPRRPIVKNAMYARIYGAGPERFSITAGISFAQGQEIFDQLAATFPGIEEFSKRVVDTAKKRARDTGDAFVLSPLTGRRHVADRKREYALVNYLIQGTAAEVLKRKNVELIAAGLGEFLVLNVHDEVMLDVPVDLVDDVAQTVSDIMHDDQLFTVPLTAGTDIAFRWGEK